MRRYFPSIKMALARSNCWWGCRGTRAPCPSLLDLQNVWQCRKKKWKMKLPYDPPLYSGFYAKRLKAENVLCLTHGKKPKRARERELRHAWVHHNRFLQKGTWKRVSKEQRIWSWKTVGPCLQNTEETAKWEFPSWVNYHQTVKGDGDNLRDAQGIPIAAALPGWGRKPWPQSDLKRKKPAVEQQ